MFGDIFLPRLNEKVVVLGIAVTLGGMPAVLAAPAACVGLENGRKKKRQSTQFRKRSPKNSFSVIPTPVSLPIRA